MYVILSLSPFKGLLKLAAVNPASWIAPIVQPLNGVSLSSRCPCDCHCLGFEYSSGFSFVQTKKTSLTTELETSAIKAS